MTDRPDPGGLEYDADLRELMDSLGRDRARVSARVTRSILDASAEGVRNVTQELLHGHLAEFRAIELARLGAVPLGRGAEIFARDLAERIAVIHTREDPSHSGLGDPLDLLGEVKLRGAGRRPLNEALWSMVGDGYLEADVVRLAGEVLHRSASKIRYRIAEHAKLVQTPRRKRE
jgi:hypothetical protein